MSRKTPTKRARTGGASFDEIWKYFIRGEDQGNGHYSVKYYHCEFTRGRGKPSELKVHLANRCNDCPEDIKKYWRDKLAEQTTDYTRTPKNSELPHTQPTITQHFGSSQPLPVQINSRIDKSLTKAWIMTGIPFQVIENPFMVDFLKDLNSRYVPPSRTTLSGHLLDEEIARIDRHIDQDLENAKNLTLGNIFYNIKIKIKIVILLLIII
jgi:hypothetical protein